MLEGGRNGPMGLKWNASITIWSFSNIWKWSLNHSICIWSLIKKYDHMYYMIILKYVFLLNLVFDTRIW